MSGSASRASIFEIMNIKNDKKQANLTARTFEFTYYESVYSPEITAFLRYMDSSGVIFKKYNSSIDSIPKIKGILTDGEEFKILKVIAALENDDFFENKLKSIRTKVISMMADRPLFI